MGDPIRVLHVDDDPEFADLVSTVLERDEGQFDVEAATGAAEALDRLAEADFDAVVSDYEMPGRNGLELLEAVREDHPALPFILYTGRGSEALASEAVSAGVTDYLQKGRGTSQFDVLANRVRNAVEQYHSRRDLERTEALLEAAGDAVYALDLDGVLTTVNETLVEWTGYSREDLVGSHASLVLGEADIDRGREAVRELLETDREVVQFEGTLHTADGGTIPTEARVTLLEEDGTVQGSTGVLRDIAQRKERERELERYESIFEELEDAVYVLDEDETIVYVNSSYASMKGVDRSELVGDPITEWADDETVSLAREVREELRDGERNVGVVENVFNVTDGGTIPAELRLINITRDGGVERVGVIRDITNRKKYERRLEALSETAQELMAATSREEVARLGAETARDVLGLDANGVHLYDEEEDALVPVAATDEGEDLVAELPAFSGEDSIAWRVYQRGEPLAVDDVHADPDIYNPDSPVRGELYLPVGEYGILIACSPTPESFDQRDVVLGEILAGSIATALEQVERTEQLREREQELTRQNERLEEFAGVVSHDLRNPLNVAQGRVELAREETGNDHLEDAAEALDRSQTLIDDLLALAREGASTGEREPVALPDLLEACWATVETGDGTLRVETDLTVSADESRLRQLFENLVRNAVEHGSTSPGSQARQDTVEHGGEAVTVTVGDLEGGFYVEDDGSGIPPEERDSVFDPGHSTSEEGTGFGLAIVREIANAHGWSVRVTEGAAGGARFEFTGLGDP
ncbi:PAS domain S-box protein [Salinirussus salinus]|uniref:PAS domain S-box protein n=1 Tax=Salinirussus salinus TaxID=1198300 RepID=UPI0013575519|nr:PAS domain S-box protein [Salinirussus salinus]